MRCICFLGLVLGLSVCTRASTIQFADFSDVNGLQLNGNARTANRGDGPALRLTSKTAMQSGSAYCRDLLDISTFATFFTFDIVSFATGPKDSAGEQGADGFALVVQAGTHGPASLGSVGDGLGYEGVRPSAAVEFDIWMNIRDAPNHDPSSNHIGILVNGKVDHGTGSPWTMDLATHFDNQGLWYAWVSYDGATLEVRVNRTGVYPAQPNLSRLVDLCSILGQSTAYVGFSGGTGSGLSETSIHQWTYVSRPEPNEHGEPSWNEPPVKLAWKDTLLIQSFVEGCTRQGLFSYVEKRGNLDGLDANDVVYSGVSGPRSSKIVSVVSRSDPTSKSTPFLEFTTDARPQDSTGVEQIELSTLAATGTALSQLNAAELRFWLAEQDSFWAKPLTLQQFDPCDPGLEFPQWNIRTVITRNNHRLILGSLGSVEPGHPYSFWRLTHREVADINGDSVVDSKDLTVLKMNLGFQGVSVCDIASADGYGLPDGVVDETDLNTFLEVSGLPVK